MLYLKFSLNKSIFFIIFQIICYDKTVIIILLLLQIGDFMKFGKKVFSKENSLLNKLLENEKH